MAKQQPDLLRKFGGHAMAAGVTLAEADLPRFIAALKRWRKTGSPRRS